MKNCSKDRSDQEIIRAILESKDVNLFGILYDRYTKIVFNKCFSFVHNSWEAEDLTHDVFLRAFIKLSTYNADSKFSTWIYSITVNYCIDYIRRRKIIVADIDTTELYKYVHLESIEETLFSINAERLAQILDLLPPEDKMILLLKYQDEFSIQELSDLLEIGKSAVKMRLSRAREKAVFLYKTQFEKNNTKYDEQSF